MPPSNGLIFLTYITLIVVAEAITSFLSLSFGLLIHSMLLVSLLCLSALWKKNSQASNVFLCLSIAPLIRVFSLSMPLQYFPSYVWYLIAGVPMLVAAITVVWLEGLTAAEIGLTIKKPVIQLAITFTGIPFGIMEYLILRPAPTTMGFNTLSFIFLAVGIVVATGFVEELVFRGILQNNAIKAYGTKAGLISVAAIFAALHIGWLQVLDVFFVFSVGLFFGILVLKTGSLLGVSLSHGLTNVFLFLIMPSAINLISTMTP
jgi:uncharacterized protein